ncbi:MAG TPA: ferric reductase-like transmembrane domain-containing protein [Anaerolineaceae bacterium]|nr:ferric reductase-like transmembrane domain-containing protein [Anaerolineaceae bacterium]HQP09596.1 ferric reductase-like transmembrane domain-containing protein [Anaerolineaceae bacterium]
MKRTHVLAKTANLLIWLPAIVILFLFLADGLSFNPIGTALHWMGRFAAGFFVLSLAVTPLVTLTGISSLAVLRRPLGLAAFYYASLHVLIYITLDQNFNLLQMWRSFTSQPYIWIGAAAFLILIILGVTALKKVMRKMGKRWKVLQRLAYLGVFAVLMHYAMARKGNLFTLQGDIVVPLTLLGITLVLLVLRLPFIRKGILRLRKVST